MTKLTKRQSEVMQLIEDHMASTGAPPTRAEIATFMGFKSPNAAEDHLRALARKGFIELVPGTSRGIRLLVDHSGLPIVGTVAAGAPILAQEHIQDTYKMDRGIFHPNADYLLRVKGDSMKNIGILNGDLLVVHSTSDVHAGQVVVARVDDEVTVKRFYRDGNVVTLSAENEHYQPIKVDLSKQNLVIEGVGVGVIRNMSLSSDKINF
ncbi:MAG TPA: transcriptional repressor LexA [Gammaproteobacteria bacterium]|nr:transcriptional repressor LexA [Gammaproteobacteria bacterium]